jgi:hypothetical protein
MESKKDVYDLLPKAYYPKTLLCVAGSSFATVWSLINEAGINFPLIAKPDIGERGLAVKKINNKLQLQQYIQHMPVDFLIQQFIPYHNEVGIFYCKLPNAKQGYISGIVKKEPVVVTGDGVSDLKQLVWQNNRYILQWQQIKALFKDDLNRVLPQGEQLMLIPYGNHCRGSKFTDETFRVNEKLSRAIHRICNQIPEFYYGRMDIRFDTWQALEEGKDFYIIELNGSGSEPTHIYDPSHSLFFAWREIIKHWKVLYQISKSNHKNGVPYTSAAQCRKDVKSFNKIRAALEQRIW